MKAKTTQTSTSIRLGAALQYLRVCEGYTRRALAEAAGIGADLLEDVEWGEADLGKHKEHLAALCRVLSTDEAKLLSLSDELAPESLDEASEALHKAFAANAPVESRFDCVKKSPQRRRACRRDKAAHF